jgi:hypothetical protein
MAECNEPRCSHSSVAPLPLPTNRDPWPVANLNLLCCLRREGGEPLVTLQVESEVASHAPKPLPTSITGLFSLVPEKWGERLPVGAPFVFQKHSTKRTNWWAMLWQRTLNDKTPSRILSDYCHFFIKTKRHAFVQHLQTYNYFSSCLPYTLTWLQSSNAKSVLLVQDQICFAFRSTPFRANRLQYQPRLLNHQYLSPKGT